MRVALASLPDLRKRFAFGSPETKFEVDIGRLDMRP